MEIPKPILNELHFQLSIISTSYVQTFWTVTAIVPSGAAYNAFNK